MGHGMPCHGIAWLFRILHFAFGSQHPCLHWSNRAPERDQRRNHERLDSLAKVIIIDQPETDGHGMTANVRTGRGITEFTETKHQCVDQDQDLRLTVPISITIPLPIRGPMASREGGKPSEMSLLPRCPAAPGGALGSRNRPVGGTRSRQEGAGLHTRTC